MSVDAILKEVAALSVGERIDLLDQIWELYLEPDLVVDLSDERRRAEGTRSPSAPNSPRSASRRG